MTIPALFTPESLKDLSVKVLSEDGRWVFARSERLSSLSLFWRLKAAYMVFIGRWRSADWNG